MSAPQKNSWLPTLLIGMLGIFVGAGVLYMVVKPGANSAPRPVVEPPARVESTTNPTPGTHPDPVSTARTSAPATGATAGGNTRGIGEITTEPVARADPPYQGVFVICVGINQNPAYRTLDFAVADSERLAQVCRTKYGFTNVVALTDSNATKEAIINSIEGLRSRLTTGGKDDVLFFYSGHGATWPEETIGGGKTNVTRHGFLLTFDPGTNAPVSLPEFRQRHLEMTELVNRVAALPARHRLLCLDSCFSGLAIVQQAALKSAPSELYQDVITRPTVQIMTAGLDTEEVREDPTRGYGVFTDALVQQLEAGDVRTMEEVFLPLRVTVRQSLDRLKHPLSMTPQHRYLVQTNGTFVWVPLDKVNTWAAVRPTNSVITDAEAKGYFQPVTLSEVTNLQTAATAPNAQWQSRVDRYETRAAMGDEMAIAALAQIYGRGIGVPTNSARARLYRAEGSDVSFSRLAGIKDPVAGALLDSIMRFDFRSPGGANLPLATGGARNSPDAARKSAMAGVAMMLMEAFGKGGSGITGMESRQQDIIKLLRERRYKDASTKLRDYSAELDKLIGQMPSPPPQLSQIREKLKRADDMVGINANQSAERALQEAGDMIKSLAQSLPNNPQPQ